MIPRELETALEPLPLGGVRYFDSLDSTNSEAARWAEAGCPDLCLVVADEQRAGRGRGGRRWYTPRGAALAFTLVLHMEHGGTEDTAQDHTTRLNGLGALAVCLALQKSAALSAAAQPAQIKWPNDILIRGKKVAGVLSEAHWLGNQLNTVILGVGINVAASAVPPRHWDAANPHPFPAGCVETAAGQPVSRWALLHAVLTELLAWRGQVMEAVFLKTWTQNLAFKGSWVQITFPDEETPPLIGKIRTLGEDGALHVETPAGEIHQIHSGELHQKGTLPGGPHLRPVDSSGK